MSVELDHKVLVWCLNYPAPTCFMSYARPKLKVCCIAEDRLQGRISQLECSKYPEARILLAYLKEQLKRGPRITRIPVDFKLPTHRRRIKATLKDCPAPSKCSPN